MPTVTPKKTYPFSKFFREWRALKGQDTMITDRMNKLRDGMRDAIKDLGYEQEGHYFFDFPTPVEYQEPAVPGKKSALHIYTGLKAERRLIPASPTPDPDRSEALLRKKGKWMTEEQEKMLQALQLACPNVAITVECDTEAVAGLYWAGKLSEKEYQSVLVTQTEQWAFVPQEQK